MKGATVPTGRAMTVETLLDGGGASSAEQDVLLVSGHVYGVFGGRGAAAVASEAFGERTSASLVELCAEANGRIAAKGAPEAGFGATVSAVRVEREAFDWVLVGESELVVILPDGSFDVISSEGPRGPSLDGGDAALSAVRSGRRKLAGVRHVVLCTSGLVGGKGDVSALVERLLAGGLAAAREGASGALAAIVLSFLPPNPAPPRKKASKKRTGVRGTSSGVASRRRRGRPS